MILSQLVQLVTAPKSAQTFRNSMEYAKQLAFGSDGLRSAVA